MIRLIIEGITGSGKTTISRKIKTGLSDEMNNMIFLSQFYTSSIGYKEVQHVANQKIDAMIKTVLDLVKCCDLGYSEYGVYDEKRKINVILECFHIENFAKGYITDEFLWKAIDKVLYELGFKLVILYLPEEEIYERCIESTRKYRSSEKWDQYLLSLGEEKEEINYFKEIQNNIMLLSEGTNMEKIIINTSGMEWDKYVKQITHFGKEN